MTSADLSAKIKETSQLLQSLMQHVNLYEGQIYNKEMELKNLESRIAGAREEHKSSEGKASMVLGKASEEAALLRKNAQDLMDKAREQMAVSLEAKKQADAVIAEAKTRSAKLESDEKAFHANLTIWERKKAALESALRQ